MGDGMRLRIFMMARSRYGPAVRCKRKEGHAPTTERTVDPARMFAESLTIRSGIRKHKLPIASPLTEFGHIQSSESFTGARDEYHLEAIVQTFKSIALRLGPPPDTKCTSVA